MSDKLITIAKYNDYLKADIDRQALEDNGIKATISGQSAAGVFVGVPTLSYLELMVFEKDKEKALEILKTSRKKNPSDDNPPEDDFPEQESSEQEPS